MTTHPDTPALRALRAELRYYQAAARLDLRAVRKSMARSREIGAKMRAERARVGKGKPR